MRVEELIDAIGAIDPVYVREAEEWRHRQTFLYRNRKVLLPLAACLGLIVLGSAYGLFRNGGLFGDKGMSGGAGMESAADAGAGMDAGAAAPEDAAAQPAEEMAEDAGINDADEAVQSADAAGAADVNGKTGEAEAGEGAAAGSASDAAGNAGPDQASGADRSESGGPDRETHVVINEVAELRSEIYCMPGPASSQYLPPEELAAYYGVEVLPKELPEGYELTDVPAEGYAIAYDEKGHLLDDHIRLFYENADTGGRFTLSVRTTESGEIISFADDALPVSLISGNEATIGHYTEGTGAAQKDAFLALFEKEGVQFAVQADGMDGNTFLAVLEALQ